MPLMVVLFSTVLLGDLLTEKERPEVEVWAEGSCPDAAEIANQLAPLLPDWTVTPRRQPGEPLGDASPPAEPATHRSVTLRHDAAGTLWIGNEATATSSVSSEHDCRVLAQELAVAAALALDPPELEPEAAAPPPPEAPKPEVHVSLLASGGVLGSLAPSGPARATGALEMRLEVGAFRAALGAWMAGPGDFEFEGATVALASYAPHLTVGARWGSGDLRGGFDLGVELEGVHASGANFDEALSGTAWHVGIRTGVTLEWRLTGPLFLAVPASVTYFPTSVELVSAVGDAPMLVGQSPGWLLRGGVGFGVYLR